MMPAMASFTEFTWDRRAHGGARPSRVTVTLGLGASVVIVALEAVGAFGGTAAASGIAFACVLAAVAVHDAGRRAFADLPSPLSTDYPDPVAITARRAATLAGERDRRFDAA